MNRLANRYKVCPSLHELIQKISVVTMCYQSEIIGLIEFEKQVDSR